jgi:hypothetical protein
VTCGVRFFLFDNLRLLAQDDDFHSDRRLDHEQHEFAREIAPWISATF